MKLSRAYSLAYGEDCRWGRVQTPTLAMLVDVSLRIQRFVPDDYLEIVASFHPTAAPGEPRQGRGFAHSRIAGAIRKHWQKAIRLPATEEAERIIRRARTGTAGP